MIGCCDTATVAFCVGTYTLRSVDYIYGYDPFKEMSLLQLDFRIGLQRAEGQFTCLSSNLVINSLSQIQAESDTNFPHASRSTWCGFLADICERKVRGFDAKCANNE